ncbi:MAG: Hsp33 family molecular chaperone HslO [Anaerovoracaceae bacterium]
MSKVLIAVDKSGSYRVYLTITTDLVEEARSLHDITPLATASLGRVLTGAGIMSIMLKNPKDRLTVMFKGDGPAKQILAVGTGDGSVKGYIADPKVDLPLTKEGKLDVGGALGVGELTVIKDMGLKEPYVGTIALVSGEIAEDLTAYHYISEQQNTSIALGVKVGREWQVLTAGGMFIQMLPGAQEEAIDAIEEILTKMKPITTLVAEGAVSAGGKTEEEVLEDLLGKIFCDIPQEYTPKALEYREIKWRCDCSKERMERALMAIGRSDLEEILTEDRQAELECHFCGSKYGFTEEELQKMIEEI